MGFCHMTHDDTWTLKFFKLMHLIWRRLSVWIRIRQLVYASKSFTIILPFINLREESWKEVNTHHKSFIFFEHEIHPHHVRVLVLYSVGDKTMNWWQWWQAASQRDKKTDRKIMMSDGELGKRKPKCKQANSECINEKKLCTLQLELGDTRTSCIFCVWTSWGSWDSISDAFPYVHWVLDATVIIL